MGILEGILYMIWRGIAIGIIISAPMGPVGILCVQRTLETGRKTGFYTGVGAGISDLFYCLLTGFGLSFVEEFLNAHQNIIQLIGSVVLIAFGVYLFKSNPSRKLKKPSERNVPAGKSILSGFLFTFSNPLIIFLIIGLFARFNFMMPEIRFWHYMIGFVSIFAGALLWWYVVTFFIDKVRAHFNLRSMWLINKIIGGVIFLFAIVGIISATGGLIRADNGVKYLNSVRGMSPLTGENKGPLTLRADSCVEAKAMLPLDGLAGWRIDFRAANINNVPGKAYSYTDSAGIHHKVKFPGWGLIFKGKEGESRITFRTDDDPRDETYRRPFVGLTYLKDGETRVSEKITTGLDLFDGENAFRMSLREGRLTISGGNRAYDAMRVDLGRCGMIDSIGFYVMPGGMLKVDWVSVQPLRKGGVVAGDSIGQAEILNKIKGSSDPMEGVWMVFDRTLENDWLRMGGDYRLAFVKRDKGYDMVYLGGAVTLQDDWREGMLKGRLVATPFEDVYDVEWYDASGSKVTQEIKAQYQEPLLKIMFPVLNSELRMKRID